MKKLLQNVFLAFAGNTKSAFDFSASKFVPCRDSNQEFVTATLETATRVNRLKQALPVFAGLMLLTGTLFAQVPVISYSPSTHAFPESTAETIAAPGNTGGSVSGGYSAIFSTTATPARIVPIAITTTTAGTSYYLAYNNRTGVDYIYQYVGGVSTVMTVTGVTFNDPVSIGIDGAGNLYVADDGYGEVFKFTISGTTATLAATIGTGAFTDGGIYQPLGLAFDSSNNVYIADAQDDGASDGIVFEVAAGTTTATPYITGLNDPYGVAVDGSGDTFVSLQGNNTVEKINGTSITTLAGTYNEPQFLTTDAAGDVFIADYGDNDVKEVSAAGIASTLLTTIADPIQVSFDGSKNMYIVNGNNLDIYESQPTTYYTITPAASLTAMGLTFNATTGAITGTTSATVKTAVTFTVSAYNSSGIGTTTITISVNAATGAPTISYTGSPFTYTQGTAIANLNATVTGAPTTYSISPALPTGLTFTTTGANAGRISGTPTVSSSTTSYTITVSNANGSGFAVISITVNALAPVLTYPTTNTFATNAAVTITPTASGGTTTSVTISPALPAGLYISNTGVITGSSSVATTGTYKVTPSNSSGAGAASNSFTITIAVAPAFSYTTPYQPTEGVVMTPLAPTVTAGSPTSYAEAGTLPTGVTFNTTTGTFSGTPTSGTTRTINVTATNAAGLSTTVTVIIKPTAAALFSYTNPAAYTEGTAIPTLTPTSTFTLSNATISPALPTGLSISGAGVITGTPTVTSSATIYTVTALSSNGYYSTATVTITVNAPAAPNLNYTPASYSYTTGISNTTVTINNTGGPVSGTYTLTILTGALPTGITFNTANGTFTVVPTAAGAFTGSVSASNVTGSSSTPISMTVTNPAAPSITYSSPAPNYTFTQNVALTVATEPTPTNTGGALPSANAYSYTGTLPTGLAFSTTTGIISGTPTVVTTASITVTATNAGGSNSATFTIQIYQPVPTVAYTGSPYTFYVGVPITMQTPGTTNSPTSFSISPSLTTNTGLAFSTTTGAISGTPTTSSVQTTYTVSASNSNPTPGTTTIKVTVIGAPALSYSPSSDTYTQNTGNDNITITNTGGAPTSAYAESGTLPTGITFSTVTGTFTVRTGTVAVGTYSFTVNASNPAGSSVPAASITIIINPVAPVVTYTTPNTWTVGTAYTLNPTTGTGGAVSTWSYTGTLPPGVTFNTTNGVISGTPTTPGSYSVTVTGTNVTGSSSPTVNFTIDQPAPNIAYVTPDVYESGATVSLTPTNTESAITTSYAVTTGTLPTGLTLNTTTGVISGTVPTITTSSTTTVTITAYTGSSSGTVNVSITYNPLPPVITYTNPSPYVQGTAISSLTPTDSGGPVATTGTYASTVVLKAANGLSKPYGMAADTSGNVYVVNYSGNSVTEYSTTGTVTSTSISAATTGPVGIVFDSSDNAYVLTGTEVIEYAGGNFAGTGTPIITGLNGATGIAISGSTLYIANAGANNILEYPTTGGTATLTITPPSINFFGFTLYTAYVSAGIAVDAAGNIYVADNDYEFFNTGVDEYNSTGTLTNEYPQGTTNSAVYIDASGNIYVTDTGAGSVTVSTAAFAATVDTETGFNSPRGTVADGLGDYFVSDYNNNTVTEYSPVKGYYLTGTLPPGLYFNTTTGIVSGTPQTTFSSTTYTVTAYNVSGKSTTTFKISCGANPPVIAYTPSTEVVELNTAIATPFTPAASGGPILASSFTTPGTALTGVTTALKNPWGMFKDSNGDIWVANYGNATVDEFGPTGTFIKTYQLTAATVGNITGVAVNPARTVIYVTNSIGEVFEYVLSSGTTTLLVNLRSGTYGEYGADLDGIAENASGYIFFTDEADGIVWEYTGTGNATEFIAKGTDGLTTPTGIAIDGAGNILVVDQGAKKLLEFSPYGTFEATIVSGLTAPYGLYVDGNGDDYIGDYMTGGTTAAVKEYNDAGTLITTITGLATLTNPRGLVTDASGDIYVSDYTDNTVTEYTPNFYSISPTLPAGLTFNTSTGAIGGTPSTVFGPTTFTVSVDGSDGNGSTTITITCASPPVFTYTPTSQVDTVGMSSPSMSPNVTAGSPITSYAVTTGTLPAGLSINATTGVISGTPTATSPLTTYTVTATNSYGFTGTAPVTITVVNPRPPNITYTTPDVYTTNVAITPTLSPTNTGGIVVTYSAPSLPAGLTIDPITGIISGTATTITAATNYPVTATNAGGSSTFNINITVNPPLPAFTYTTPDVYYINTAITPALDPNSTGGPVLTWAISPALPPGLSFDVTSGNITGTPTTLSPATNYTVSATNAAGTVTFVINITVDVGAPIIAYTTPDTYTVGSVIPPLAPTNTGGTPVTYSVSSLPAGLTLNTTTGVITGTPTAVTAAANYTVTATNTGGSGTFVINIACVAGGPVLSYTSPDVFPVGTAITPISPVNTGTTPVSYGISPGLPTGLNFDTTTGIISGTPTVTSAATTYTVTATDASSNTGTATIVIACSGYVDWIGVTSNDWNVPANWSTGAVPTATDIAGIGVNQTFLNFPNLGPSGAATNSVAAVVIGSSSIKVTAGTSATAQAGGFVVNTGSTLNVTGNITYQSDANAGTLTATLSGPGTVNAAGIDVTANTTLGAAYTETLASSVSSLNISSDITLNSSDNSGTAFNSTFNVTGGVVALTGVVTTTNTAAATSTLAVLPATTATLQFANSAGLSGLSATGTNVINFNNTGATVEYSGVGQTYYTDAAITGLSTGVQYNSLKFSGSGLKSPTGTTTNNVFIAGDFTNALTLNDATDFIDFSEPAVIFDGATQNIYAGNGTGTLFYNSTFSGTGTTTIQNGNLYVAPIGTLTMAGTATLAAGGFLTLNSSNTATAAIAPIPSGCSITGTVNVQRYVSGDRSYRLMSSQVSAGTSPNGIASMNYLLNSMYLTGPGTGFTATGNPTLFLYDESFVPQYSTFYNSNYIAVSSMTTGTGNTPTYPVYSNGAGLTGSYTVPAANGYYVFYRGNLSEGTANLTSPTYSPVLPTIATASGTLNQGQVNYAAWYAPSSSTFGGVSQYWYLIGNPYASAIDLATVQGATTSTGIFMTPYNSGTNTGITSFIYELNPANGIYAIYNTAGPSTLHASEFIGSGQGFMIEAYGANSSQLVFNESAKATSTNANMPPGFMSKRINNLAAINPGVPNPILRLRMTLDSINDEETIITFNPKSSPGFVINEDARHWKGNGLIGFTSISSDNVPLAINSLPLAATLTIPLRTVATNDGLYNISFSQQAPLPALYEIWLKDAYMKDSLDIKDNPTYNFNILHSDTNSFGDHRFSLVIRQNPALMVHLLSFNAIKATGGDNVLWTTENEANYTNFAVQRSTDGGTTFTTIDALVSSSLGAYSYLDSKPVQGANSYRLQLTDLNGNITYSNVVTIMYANTGNQIALNGFMVYPNPTAGAVNLSINQPTANASAAYTIQIVNNLGVVLKTAQSSSPQWQTDVSALNPGTYFITVMNTSTNTLVGRTAFVKL